MFTFETLKGRDLSEGKKCISALVCTFFLLLLFEEFRYSDKARYSDESGLSSAI